MERFTQEELEKMREIALQAIRTKEVVPATVLPDAEESAKKTSSQIKNRNRGERRRRHFGASFRVRVKGDSIARYGMYLYLFAGVSLLIIIAALLAFFLFFKESV